MVFDCDVREVAMAAIDTAYPMTALGPDTPGAFVVPTTASRITAIRISVGGISATDSITGTTTAIHIYGGGVQLSEGWFIGPSFSQAGAAATSGGIQSSGPMIYRTNIPVRAGGIFSIDAFKNGEDEGTLQMAVCIEYDGIAGKIIDGDYREVDCGAAANTFYTLANRGAAVAEGDFRPNYNKICEIVVGGAVDPVGDAANGLNYMLMFHLSGGGLVHAGNYNFIGPAGNMLPDTDVAGDQTSIVLPTRYECDIAVKRGDSVRAQVMNIESIQASHAIIGFLYSA